MTTAAGGDSGRRTLPDHDQCDTHRGYKLSCDQYERLLARSGQLCEICRKSVAHTQCGKLHIDHSGPKWAVRGLLCTPCNTRLRDGTGWFAGGPEYLASTWWIQECRRLGLPTALSDEPEIGGAIRDQHMTVWIRYADGIWHPHGGRSDGKGATWGRIFEMRGPQNMAPFDVHGPDGSDLLRFYSDRAIDQMVGRLRETAAYERGRLDCAREVLAELSETAIGRYLDSADDGGWGEAHGEPQTEAGLHVDAAVLAMDDIYTDLAWLQDRVVKSLETLPGNVGLIATREARTLLYEQRGASFSRCQFTAKAMSQLWHAVQFAESHDYLLALPDGHHEAWLEYAAAAYPGETGSVALIVAAAGLARKCADGLKLRRMCNGSGPLIDACPADAVFDVRFAPCCHRDTEEPAHRHGLCEKHLEQAVDGTLPGRGGALRILADYEAIPEPEPEPAPF